MDAVAGGQKNISGGTMDKKLSLKQKDAIVKNVVSPIAEGLTLGSLGVVKDWLEENTEEEVNREQPYKGEVPCYWCELENKNKGYDLPPFNNAACVAKEPFEGKYACLAHGDLLLISGWYGGLLEEKPPFIKAEQDSCPLCKKPASEHIKEGNTYTCQ